MTTTDPHKAERTLALIHNADALGFFAAADPDILAPLAHAMAAETVLGNFAEVAEVAAAHSIPRAGVELLVDAAMAVYFPLSAAVRHIQLVDGFT